MISSLKILLVVIISFSGGAMISGAIFAFIAAIGVVPSIAYKTKTTQNILLYEECIIFGGIFGACETFLNYQILIGDNILGKFVIMFFSLCTGLFIGVLASSLAETVNVIPIFSKRVKLVNEIGLFMLSIAIGKLFGSILYFLNSGFRV